MMFEFLTGFVIGIITHRIYVHLVVYSIEKRIEKKTDIILEKFREKIIPSRLELVDGMYFIYNRETNEFLGQANSMTELENVMKSKYPNKLFDVPNEQLMEAMKGKTNV